MFESFNISGNMFMWFSSKLSMLKRVDKNQQNCWFQRSTVLSPSSQEPCSFVNQSKVVLESCD